MSLSTGSSRLTVLYGADGRQAGARVPVHSEDAALPGGWPQRTWRDQLSSALTRPEVLRPVFWVLRRFAPVLRFRNQVVVSRHADVVDVLRRDQDFTIAPVNEERMARWSGAFILGMDRGEAYDREDGALRRAVPPEDLPRIRALVAEEASGLLEAARPRGRIDVVGDYARVVAARLVGRYFGVPGPDQPTTMRWMRALFDAVFIDDGPRVRRAAAIAVSEQKPYMDALIAQRRAEVEASRPVPDDVLTRLVAMGRSEPWLDDDAVRRNINGLIVGALDTTSKAVAHAVHELLRRPDALRAAGDAAQAGDIDAVHSYVWEALRFRPHSPVLKRHCETDVSLGPRHTLVPAGTTVTVSLLSAMFDQDAFPGPGRMAGRPLDGYLHFGHGMHTCFGLAINGVQLPEMVAGLLRLPALRRAPGKDGRLVYDGPFPDRLVVAFGGQS